MGHEGSGVIEEVGSMVTNFKVGDRVTFDSTIFCGACPFCKQGLFNLCDNRRVLGVGCDEYKQDGIFAEYAIIEERVLFHLPEGLSSRKAMVEPSRRPRSFPRLRRFMTTWRSSGRGSSGCLHQAASDGDHGKIIARHR